MISKTKGLGNRVSKFPGVFFTSLGPRFRRNCFGPVEAAADAEAEAQSKAKAESKAKAKGKARAKPGALPKKVKRQKFA